MHVTTSLQDAGGMPHLHGPYHLVYLYLRKQLSWHHPGADPAARPVARTTQGNTSVGLYCDRNDGAVQAHVWHQAA